MEAEEYFNLFTKNQLIAASGINFTKEQVLKLMEEYADFKCKELEEQQKEENKYHFAREIISELRTNYSIENKVYLYWIDKLIKEKQEMNDKKTNK